LKKIMVRNVYTLKFYHHLVKDQLDFNW
jgi:hypothetical protein